MHSPVSSPSNVDNCYLLFALKYGIRWLFCGRFYFLCWFRSVIYLSPSFTVCNSFRITTTAVVDRDHTQDHHEGRDLQEVLRVVAGLFEENNVRFARFIFTSYLT